MIAVLWDMPDANEKQEHIWVDSSNAIFAFEDIIDSVWHVNAPSDLISTTDLGLEFVYDPNKDVSAYDSWLHFRAEIREEPQSSPTLNETTVYCLRFKANTMPNPIGAAAAPIFQRFNTTLDAPDLDIELTAAGQFGGIDANTIAIYANNDVWTTPNTGLETENDLVIAIENKVDGAYKVSLNGDTLKEGTGDFVPNVTYTGPQFGVYNHGENADDMKITHSQYAKYDYIIKPDFNLINSISLINPIFQMRMRKPRNRIGGLPF